MTSPNVKAGIVIAALLVVAPAISAQEPAVGPLEVWHPVLAASVERLSSKSASWREALNAVAATGRRTVVTATDKVEGPFDIGALAQAHPIVDEQQRIDTVVVVINLELMQRLSGLPVKAVQFEDDLDRILAHEVYGHAVPYLLTGTTAGLCADPAPGQRATDACAIKRENQIRKELRLGQRFDYGREGLALARRSWQ